MERRVVVGRVAGCKALLDQRPITRPPQGLPVVVRAEAPGEQPEAVVERVEVGAEGVGDAALEPAVRPGAHAADDRSALPGTTKGDVDAVCTPDREGVRRVPARDVDDVLRRQLLDGALGNAEETETARLAFAARERLEERCDSAVRIARGRRNEAHSRPWGGGQRQHEVVEG